MFGVQPPQTLYHTRTRHSPRPTDRVHSTERPSHYSEREAVLPASRNVNQGSYLVNKDGKQSRHRASSHSHSHSHSHSESMPLLDPVAGSSSGKRASAVYMHYRYSLNSLGDIIDRVSFTYEFVPFWGTTYSHAGHYRTTGNPWLSFIRS
jgi:hypothetical protein